MLPAALKFRVHYSAYCSLLNDDARTAAEAAIDCACGAAAAAAAAGYDRLLQCNSACVC